MTNAASYPFASFRSCRASKEPKGSQSQARGQLTWRCGTIAREKILVEGTMPKKEFWPYMRALSPAGALATIDVEACRVAARATLLFALGASAFYYYTLNVYVQMLSLPVLVVVPT
jgi:hypothetical protein